jgi:hypothetical protein
MGSVQSSDSSSVTVDRTLMGGSRRPREINLILEEQRVTGLLAGITFARGPDADPSGSSSGSSNHVQPLVARVAFPRESTNESDGILRPSPSSWSPSSSSTSDDDDMDAVLQILFHFRHMYLMSELDERDVEHKREEQKALLDCVEELISNGDIYAPAA